MSAWGSRVRKYIALPSVVCGRVPWCLELRTVIIRSCAIHLESMLYK